MPDDDNPFEKIAKLLPEELGLTRLLESPYAIWFTLLLGLVAIATAMFGVFEAFDRHPPDAVAAGLACPGPPGCRSERRTGRIAPARLSAL